MKISDAFPGADVTTLAQLQQSDDRKGPFRLYVYEPNSEYHRSGVWFMEKPKYPEEGEIGIADANLLASRAIAEGREVRVCDGGDMLVFHWRNGRCEHGESFWSEIGA